MRRLIIKPISEYNNMCDFLNMLSSFINHHDEDDYPFPFLEEFSFTFHVLVSIDKENDQQGGMMYGYYQHPNAIIRGKKRYYGTGGVILKTLRHFVSSVRSLKRFKLNNLLLESNNDVGACFEELMGNSIETLEYLEVLNYTSHIIPLYNIGLFPNLRKITISSHSLNDEVLLLFANHLCMLSHLNIVQDELTIPCRYSDEVWIEIQNILNENKRSWHIKMSTRGKCKSEPFWPASPAPVTAIVYDTRTTKIVQSSIYACTENYSKTLEIYVRIVENSHRFMKKNARNMFQGHLQSMCRLYIPRSFLDRADMAYINLVRNATYLHTLAIKERISTATCLLIAYYGSQNNLKYFYLRRNCVILRNEYRQYRFNGPYDDNDHLHQWLEKNCRQYDKVEKAVSILFDKPWKMLSDWEYNRMRL